MTTGGRGPCGTLAGSEAHRARGEDFCPPCKAARSGYTTAYRHRKADRQTTPRCGTEKGLIHHWIRDENPCPLCQSWHRAYLRSLALG